ncbi:seizure protein 6 homolog [Amblyraja radiata]|uniref:seizure protein 6 homolog n=1 Tax=Amblyraja radiata TaxID=386614 RepID=UPI0014027A5A|nr:seizure protein 6 homolog [Amblyraja radiata]
MNGNAFSRCRPDMKAMFLLVSLLLSVYSEDVTVRSGGGVSVGELGMEPSTMATTAPPEEDFHFVSTTQSVNINNHRPLLEEVVRESLPEKTYLGQESYLRAGARLGPALPQSPPPQPSPASLMATAHTAAISDVATTARVGRNSPMTTAGGQGSLLTGAAPLVMVPAGATGQTVATTDPLTTAAVKAEPGDAASGSERGSARTAPGSPPVTRAGSPTPADAGGRDANKGPVTNDTPTPVAAAANAHGTRRPSAPGAQTTHGPNTDLTLTYTPYEAEEETTTTTIITTTIITTVQTPVPCSFNFTDTKGFVESPEYPSHLFYSNVDCIYTITVYTGYGVELQVKNINVSEGEMLTIEALDGDGPTVLANESILMKGQVIRSPSNQLSIHFQSIQLRKPGSFQFHYQGE